MPAPAIASNAELLRLSQKQKNCFDGSTVGQLVTVLTTWIATRFFRKFWPSNPTLQMSPGKGRHSNKYAEADGILLGS
jgi:hypothetical protein